jgi:hypothetical protein
MRSAAKLASQLAGKDGKYDLVYPQNKRASVLDYVFESAANQLSRSLKEKADGFGGIGYLYRPSM